MRVRRFKRFQPVSEYPASVIFLARGAARKQWAADPNTAPELLEQLAYDPNDVVRQHVARNPSTDRLHLMKLASDRDATVVDGVIHNTNTPVDALVEIARHPRVSNRDLKKITDVLRARDPNRLADLIDVIDEKCESRN